MPPPPSLTWLLPARPARPTKPNCGRPLLLAASQWLACHDGRGPSSPLLQALANILAPGSSLKESVCTVGGDSGPPLESRRVGWGRGWAE